MPPPPATWKGYCEFNFMACNNKIIAARNFVSGDGTPLDFDGHGTHTASTAAGNSVKGANFFGNANGTAVGVAPLARLATYKVCCNVSFCLESDMLAAMDIAIDDGVNVLSVSLVGASTIDRKLAVVVVLGNNEELEGESAFQPNYFHPKQLPIVYPGLNSSGSTTPMTTS
ncbi:unnamed protein product [Fraxinus pennsylvanica]|uniref:Peptidase S8/S53 domain-containing protein n=1 Tax=Fraxinus pennsylvanica TaxID=56036 RepID=A0AAD1ZBJ8_9LAMI|nr:unnamed protein product [Fraxinus pennsylvanica]